MLRKLWIILPLLTPLSANATLHVFACEPEWATLTQTLGGTRVNVYTATTAQQDVHQIQARPSLIAQMRKSDLLVCTGAELEVGWLPLLLQRSANPNVQQGKVGHFMAAEQVERLDVLTKVDRNMGDVHASGNPHVHLDPNRLLLIAEKLSLRLQALEPDQSIFYQQQFKQFSDKWQHSIQQWAKQAKPLQGVTVVTHHKDWRYLLNWLDMIEVATLEPKPGLAPTASHLAQLKQKMTDSPAKVIMRAHYQNARPSEWLAAQTTIPAVELPYTVGGDPQANDLFSLYQVTLDRLLNATQK